MTQDATGDGLTETAEDANRSILSSSAVMAAGTVVSRLSGLVRNTLLAAALGTALHADLFNIANTVPNMLYILLAGGVFNAVLVPQLVRAMRNDADGGEAYTNRIVTLAALFLAGVTAVMVLAAPYLMRVFLSADYFEPELAEQRESVVDFARFCLPQVFFYGMFVLLGQVLNARRRFGPMMWAPIANNVISVLVLVTYLLVFGPAEDLFGGYSTEQELLLGLGSTLGIAVQLLVLVPFLKSAGFTYRPRFDFRGSGLGHTLRLGMWTVLFVIVNQIAYTVVVRLASAGTAAGVAAGADSGTGYTIYSQSFLLVMVPHSIATVSLATAILPRLSAFAADGDLAGVGRTVASTLRTTLAVIVPFALLLPLIARDVANLVYAWGAARSNFEDYVPSLVLFGLGLVFFTVHYLMLRGFYSLERTRTVFWVQCVIAVVNITLAVLITSAVPPDETAPGLVVAYAGAYAVGALGSYALLRHILGGLHTPELVRYLLRLLVAAGVATALTWALSYGVDEVWAADDAKTQAIVTLLVLTTVDVVLFLALAKAMRITEVTSVMQVLTARLPGRRRR